MTDHRTDPEEFAANLDDDADEQPAPVSGLAAPADASLRGAERSTDVDGHDQPAPVDPDDAPGDDLASPGGE